jgi:hypothetical protein
MNLNVVLGLFNMGIALLIIFLSIPLIRRKIKMNYLYGVRIKKSYKSENNWYNINAYGGKQLAIWSIPVILAGIAWLLIPINNPDQILLPLLMGAGPITICLAIALIRIMAYAKKL